MKIASMLAIGFGSALLAMSLLGGKSLQQIQQLNGYTNAISDGLLPKVKASLEIQSEMNVFRTVEYYRATAPNAEILQKAEAEIVTRGNGLRNMLLQYENMMVTPEEKNLFKNTLVAFDRYLIAAEDTAKFARQFKPVDASQAMEGEELTQIKEIRANLDKLALITAQQAKGYDKDAATAYNSSIIWIASLLIAGIFIVVVAGTLILRSIRSGVQTAIQSANLVAKGDLSQRIPRDRKDEMGELLAAVSHMQDGLKETVTVVSSSATQLAAAVEELSLITQESSQNMVSQSDETRLAASAVTEMSAAIEEVARNAAGASESSKQAFKESETGRKQALEAESAISELHQHIDHSSNTVDGLASQVQTIGTVIDVIRSIADQTNLLALNAAIEAARAGEQGRGFAVVADEVRALAARTQASTTEIEALITKIQGDAQQAVTTMVDGRRLASTSVNLTQKTGAMLAQITLRAQDISDRNLLIATAAEEQSHAAREVDKNLVNIDQQTAQATSGSAQINKAAEEMSRLAVGLGRAVSGFKI